jgi:hypothetical protein
MTVDFTNNVQVFRPVRGFVAPIRLSILAARSNLQMARWRTRTRGQFPLPGSSLAKARSATVKMVFEQDVTEAVRAPQSGLRTVEGDRGRVAGSGHPGPTPTRRCQFKVTVPAYLQLRLGDNVAVEFFYPGEQAGARVTGLRR